MATLAEIEAHIAALQEPIIPHPGSPKEQAAHLAHVTGVRKWMAEDLAHRHAEVKAGRPDPQDAVLAGPPKEKTT